VQWFVLAALGEALTAVVACAGLVAGVWFMARGPRANAGVPSVASHPDEMTEPAAPSGSPPTSFRHGTIRLAGEAGAEGVEAAPGPAVAAPGPAVETAPGSAVAAAAGPELEAAPGLAPEVARGSAPEADAAPEPAPEPALTPEATPTLEAVNEPEPEERPAPPAYVPPPMAPAPKTSFRQGRIRLGGLERGSSRDRGDEPPGEA
jgi:hypothetical protein